MLVCINLEGKPVICIEIFSGIKRMPLTEMWLDLQADVAGDRSNSNFYRKNSGLGSHFTNGPTYEYKGQTVPCLYSVSKV